jgi:hypothetical protein
VAAAAAVIRCWISIGRSTSARCRSPHRFAAAQRLVRPRLSTGRVYQWAATGLSVGEIRAVGPAEPGHIDGTNR